LIVGSDFEKDCWRHQQLTKQFLFEELDLK
jgi:hypothetical protein